MHSAIHFHCMFTVRTQALHKSARDGDLPLNSSVLWNMHILPCRPAGCTLDLKKSRHKKLGAFLKVCVCVCERKGEGSGYN